MQTRILIIEQHGDLARDMAAILPRRQYRIQVAPAAASSLFLVAAFRPDLVVLSITAPADYALLRRIRVWSEVPLIVCTSNGLDAPVARVLGDGADDCIRLPVHPEELSARIQARLRRARWTASLSLV